MLPNPSTWPLASAVQCSQGEAHLEHVAVETVPPEAAHRELRVVLKTEAGSVRLETRCTPPSHSMLHLDGGYLLRVPQLYQPLLHHLEAETLVLRQ